MTDLAYIENGLFVRFVPASPAGEDAWRIMADQENNSVLAIHKKSVLRQLRSAGYVVNKAKRVTAAEIDNILIELGIS